MHLKIINDLAHIVTMHGKKEQAAPATEAIATAKQRITEAQAMLDSLTQAAADAQAKLEAALLAGQPSAPIRIEQASLTELQIDQQHGIADAQADIERIHQLLDQHRAEVIRQADQAAIAEICKPFITFIKEQQNVN